MRKLHILSPADLVRWKILFLLALTFCSIHGIAQTGDQELEQMPKDLETDFALSALPQHLRADATVYLLDPKKGYYISHQGTNGFICFVVRTEWERSEFRNDVATPISFDARGAKTIFPVYADVEMMRSSGKYTAAQLKDEIAARFKKGIYKAPSPGISYMLGPLMRSYDDSSIVVNMTVPHYMFYAPYLTAADIGCSSSGGPMILGDGKGPHGYILMFMNDKEKSKILEDNKDLLKRLAEYKSYFQINRS